MKNKREQISIARTQENITTLYLNVYWQKKFQFKYDQRVEELQKIQK